MNKSIPLWRDANTLLLEIEKSVRYFPRYHKYTLGAEMRQQAMRICRLINRAFIDKESKLQTVKRLVMAINDGVNEAHIIQQGTLKGGLKRRCVRTLFIQPGVELCPSY